MGEGKVMLLASADGGGDVGGSFVGDLGAGLPLGDGGTAHYSLEGSTESFVVDLEATNLRSDHLVRRNRPGRDGGSVAPQLGIAIGTPGREIVTKIELVGIGAGYGANNNMVGHAPEAIT